MINKICEIIKTIPRDKPFVDAYELAEYFYSKGVRYITPAYWLPGKEEKYICSHCLYKSKEAHNYCGSCGAQMQAYITVKIAHNGINKNLTAYANINIKTPREWKKWKKKKFRMKVACSTR